jgi:type I restriction enzyme, S subunit
VTAVTDQPKETTLGELLSDGLFADGDWVESKDQDPEGDVRLIQLADVGDGVFRDRSSRFLTSTKAKELRCTFLEPGDILVARMPEPLGRACVFPGIGQPAVTAVDVCIIRPNPKRVKPEWLVSAINSPRFRAAMQQFVRGTTRQRISRKNLGTLELSAPALPEQLAIIDSVNQLELTRSSASQHILVACRAVERFRQAVLAAACSGRLTADWRGSHPVGSGKEIVDRVAEQRRSSLGRRFKDEFPTLTDDVPEIPESWAWASPGSLCEPDRVITYGVIKLGSPVEDGVPTLRSSDVRWLRIDTSNVKQISRTIADGYRRTYLRGGEVLVTVRGTLGGVAVAHPEMSGWNVSREVAVIPLSQEVDARYCMLYIGSMQSQRWLSGVAKGVAYTGVNIEDLRMLPLPVPPLAEQREIVRRAETLLGQASTLILAIDSASKRVDRSSQAILAKAFRGELIGSAY